MEIVDSEVALCPLLNRGCLLFSFWFFDAAFVLRAGVAFSFFPFAFSQSGPLCRGFYGWGLRRVLCASRPLGC